MAASAELDIHSRTERSRNASLVSYEQIRTEYVKNPSLHPQFTAILPIEGLKDNESAYNPFAFINENGQLEVIFRCEPNDPDIEKSVIRRTRWQEGRFIVIDEIPDAQDPNINPLDQEIRVLGFVEIECDPQNPGKVTMFREKMVPIKNGKPDMTEFICGPLNEKDVRFAFVGDNQLVIFTRERKIDGDGYHLDSYLQALVLPVQKFSDLAKQISQVRECTDSRLATFTQDPLSWYGPNHVVPLKRTDGVIPVGLLEHIGKIRPEQICQNGRPKREYSILTSEYEFSPETGRSTAFTAPQIVTIASDFKETIKPKRPDLEDEVFPGSIIFGVDSPGEIPTYTIIFTGLKDQVSGVSVLPRYPFGLPLDLKLNRDFILPPGDIEKFLSSLALKNLRHH